MRLSAVINKQLLYLLYNLYFVLFTWSHKSVDSSRWDVVPPVLEVWSCGLDHVPLDRIIPLDLVEILQRRVHELRVWFQMSDGGEGLVRALYVDVMELARSEGEDGGGWGGVNHGAGRVVPEVGVGNRWRRQRRGWNWDGSWDSANRWRHGSTVGDLEKIRRMKVGSMRNGERLERRMGRRLDPGSCPGCWSCIHHLESSEDDPPAAAADDDCVEAVVAVVESWIATRSKARSRLNCWRTHDQCWAWPERRAPRPCATELPDRRKAEVRMEIAAAAAACPGGRATWASPIASRCSCWRIAVSRSSSTSRLPETSAGCSGDDRAPNWGCASGFALDRSPSASASSWPWRGRADWLSDSSDADTASFQPPLGPSAAPRRPSDTWNHSANCHSPNHQLPSTSREVRTLPRFLLTPDTARSDSSSCPRHASLRGRRYCPWSNSRNSFPGSQTSSSFFESLR